MKGTRKIHAARNRGVDYKLQIRKLSCYCPSCLGESGECENVEYCEVWEDQALKFIQGYIQKRIQVNATQNQMSQRLNKSNLNRSPNNDSHGHDDKNTEKTDDADDMRKNQGTGGTKNFQQGMFVAIKLTSNC